MTEEREMEMGVDAGVGVGPGEPELPEPTPIRLNLGCGRRPVPGWINVDIRGDVGADVVVNLDEPGWPWASGSVSEVLFNHSLEHLARWDLVLRELWRVCADGARIEIHVPHPRHDDWINDPSHAWCPTPEMLAMLSREICRNLSRAANTPLADILGVDFALTRVEMILDPAYAALEHDPALGRWIRERNNVVKEVLMELRAIKEEGAGR